MSKINQYSNICLLQQLGTTLEEDEDMPIHTSPVESTADIPSVVFIKTHKTGGSTLSQILYRWGLRRNLFFAQYPNDWMRGGKQAGPFQHWYLGISI